MHPGARPFLAAALTVAACTPALDWRDVRPAESGLQLQFPCKPSTQARNVELAGHAVRFFLHVCDAEGQSWSLAFGDVGDPGRVGLVLAELRRSAAANLGAAESTPVPHPVAGETPHSNSGRLRLHGRGPAGRPSQMRLALFTRGTWVYQATVLGEGSADEATDNFFASIRFGP